MNELIMLYYRLRKMQLCSTRVCITASTLLRRLSFLYLCFLSCIYENQKSRTLPSRNFKGNIDILILMNKTTQNIYVFSIIIQSHILVFRLVSTSAASFFKKSQSFVWWKLAGILLLLLYLGR